MKRSGTADLPLHGGRVPQWLGQRMSKLGAAITESIVVRYGRSEFLTRLSDPFWFQAFGSVMGMDWHSSGITTAVMGDLKRGLHDRADELGLYFCGGRGRHARNTPIELRAISDRQGFDADALIRTSRLTARVDNNAIADGFQIYLHTFVITSGGEWAVVQQGMNDATGMARRYHWHSVTVRDFTSEPHTGIVGEHRGEIMNLVDRQAKPAQAALLDIVQQKPVVTLQEAQRLSLPARHEVRGSDVDLKRLGAVLAVAYDRQFHDFAELLLLEKLGPRTLQTLSLVAEVVHGTPTRFSDPARFSFALGGKDRHPFPVPLKTYDESLALLQSALDTAKLSDSDKVGGFERLHRFVQAIERKYQPRADFNAAIAHENTISLRLGGRSVFD